MVPVIFCFWGFLFFLFFGGGVIIRVCSLQGYTHSTTTVPPCSTVSAQGDCLPLGTFIENILPTVVTLSEEIYLRVERV